MRSRSRLLLFAALAAAALALAVPVVLAAVSKTVVIRDAKADVDGALDLQQLKLGLGSDGRLRAAITFAAKVRPSDMLAGSGPPGSVCLRIWTDVDADPQSARPDRLVCVTARSKSKLRATVLRQDGPGLPTADGSADVTSSKSRRSLIIAVPVDALGDPPRIRYGAESTRPGCARPNCVDTVPGAPATRRFTLR